MQCEPRLQALLLADNVYTDRDTGKIVIAGTFNRLWAKEFPTTFHRPTTAYVSLTEIRGKSTLELKFVNLKSGEVLMSSHAFDVECGNPLSSVEVVLPVPPFPMPEEGVFAFELHAGGVLLGSIRMALMKWSSEK